MRAGLLSTVLSGTPLATSAPARRVKALRKTAPALAPQSATQISVVFVPATDPGAVTSAVVQRGASIAAESGAKFYGIGNSIGFDVAGNDLLLRVWAHATSTWSAAGGRVTFGASAYQPWTNIRSALTVAFETTATRVGVAFGGAGASVRLLVDRLDGSGWTNAASLRPNIGGAQAGTLYFDFGADANPAALKRVYLETSQLMCGIVVHPSAILRPYDAQRVFLNIATFGDSIGYVLFRTARLVGGELQVAHGDGSTGYGTPAAAAIGGGSPTSNANIDPVTARTSMSGNYGFNDGTQVEFFYTDRTDALIAAKPDMIIGAHGINDSTFNDINGWGWRISTSVAKVWERLRAGCGSAVLVCCRSWTGAQRGVDGKSGGEQPVAITVKAEFAKIPGPTVYIDNIDSTWTVKRADGTIITGSTGSGPWVTGIGTAQTPTGVGNADYYIGDGTHPSAWSSTTLTASVTLPAGTILVAATAGSTGNFPPTGTLSIQPVGPISYPGQVVTYTGKTATSFTGCTGGTGTFPAGSNVVMYQTVPGEDYYGDKVAAALCDALAVL